MKIALRTTNKVRIKIWKVHGQCGIYGPYFTRQQAVGANGMLCNGWGKIKLSRVLAERVV